MGIPRKVVEQSSDQEQVFNLVVVTNAVDVVDMFSSLQAAT